MTVDRSELQRTAALSMSEAELQSAVIDLARTLGWMVHHARPALRQSGGYSTPIQGDRGFPDLVLARRGVVIFAELKSEKGRPGPGQPNWLEALSGDQMAMSGVTSVQLVHESRGGPLVRVWKPSSWLSGEIEGTLR